MKKKMTLAELCEMYKGQDVIETKQGFEVYDPKVGLTFVLPDEFYLGIDGKPLDPKRMMTVKRCYSTFVALGCDLTPDPLSIQILCGRLCKVGGKVKFVPADAKMLPNNPNIITVLFRVHWDMSEGVDGSDWVSSIRWRWGHTLIYDHCDCDDYSAAGDWYWAFKLNWSPARGIPHFGAMTLLYMECQNRMIKIAEGVQTTFEQYKDNYRKMILEILAPLKDNHDWVIDDSSDYQTAIFCSGQQTKKWVDAGMTIISGRYRHDLTGYNKCRKDFAWLKNWQSEV